MMTRTFKTRHFARWMRKTELTDRALCKAVAEMQLGLIDADLGGGIVKKRVPLPSRGKRGSTRTLVATNRDSRWFFVVGFEKNEKDNISPNELEALKAFAEELLKLDLAQLDSQVKTGPLQEICHEDKS
jgi:hypothetical protein